MNVFAKLVRRLSTALEVLRAVLRGRASVEGIDVYGRPKFRRATIEALLLLRDFKLPAWETLAQHVGSILEGRTTDAVVTAHPAFLFVSGDDSVQRPELLAANIAFIACSIQLHRTYEAECPGRRVPLDVYSWGGAARERCEKARHECLLVLGKEVES